MDSEYLRLDSVGPTSRAKAHSLAMEPSRLNSADDLKVRPTRALKKSPHKRNIRQKRRATGVHNINFGQSADELSEDDYLDSSNYSLNSPSDGSILSIEDIAKPQIVTNSSIANDGSAESTSYISTVVTDPTPQQHSTNSVPNIVFNGSSDDDNSSIYDNELRNTRVSNDEYDRRISKEVKNQRLKETAYTKPIRDEDELVPKARLTDLERIIDQLERENSLLLNQIDEKDEKLEGFEGLERELIRRNEEVKQLEEELCDLEDENERLAKQVEHLNKLQPLRATMV